MNASLKIAMALREHAADVTDLMIEYGRKEIGCRDALASKKNGSYFFCFSNRYSISSLAVIITNHLTKNSQEYNCLFCYFVARCQNFEERA